ncbi:MAG: cysteine-rich CWC family protein [Polyangiaceae bacterium]
MTSSVDPSLCPVCGETNACGMTQGKTECWCMAVNIPEAALAGIPTAAKNVACICARCAATDRAAESALPATLKSS